MIEFIRHVSQLYTENDIEVFHGLHDDRARESVVSKTIRKSLEEANSELHKVL